MLELKAKTKSDKKIGSSYKTPKGCGITRLELMHMLQTQRFENFRESVEVHFCLHDYSAYTVHDTQASVVYPSLAG
jgi:hypothetical protein